MSGVCGMPKRTPSKSANGHERRPSINNTQHCIQLLLHGNTNLKRQYNCIQISTNLHYE